MSWFGEGGQGMRRRGALVLVVAAFAAACVAAVATLAGVGRLSGRSVRAAATGAPVSLVNVADRLGSTTASHAGSGLRRSARTNARTGHAASAAAALSEATSRSRNAAGETSESSRGTAHRPGAGLAGSSQARVSSTAALSGFRLPSPAAGFGAAISTDALRAATNDPLGSARAASSDPLTCTTGTIYGTGSGTVLGGTGSPGLYSLATTSLGGTSVPATLVATGAGNVNALGITAGGTAAYWVNKTNGDILEYNASTGTVTDRGSTTVPSNELGNLNAGAVNIANGYYYFAYAPSAGNMVIYAFNTATNTLVGEVATATAPDFSNGDIAFDAGGNLYWVGSSGTTAALGVIPGPIPTTAGTTALTGKTITTYSDPGSVQYDGVAFDDSGNLYLMDLNQASGTTTKLEEVAPLTGTIEAGPTDVSPAIAGTDLGTCATPPTLVLQKNVVGRIQSTDQFTLSITGPGISGSTSGATATTSGAATGIQAQVAGPLPVISANTYTITETATNNNLSSYTSTYICTDTTTSTTVTSGTGTSANVTIPTPASGELGPAVVCQFTNTPLTSSLSIAKSASPTTVTAVGQTVTYHYTVTNTGQTPLTNVHVTDTQTPPASGLTSGPTCVSLSTPTGTCSGSSTSLAVGQVATFTATYTATAADFAHGSINDSATATGTPPSGPATTSPPSTATVTSTQAAALTIAKSASPTSVTTVGQTVTYTFTVTNSGNVDLTDVHVTDTQDAAGFWVDVGADVCVVVDTDGDVLRFVHFACGRSGRDVHRDLHGDGG